MLTKTKIKTAIAAAFMLGTASAAVAEVDRDYSYGGPTQTWQDIEQSRKDIQRLIQQEYHTSPATSPNSAYDYAVPSKQTRGASHEQPKKR